MRAVFLRILGFVILIDLFYMSVGRWWLIQAEEHPPPELTIGVETDVATLVGMGETLLRTKGGCLVCHKITEQGNERGPDLRGVGARSSARQPGLAAEAYLWQSLVEPGAYVVAEFATADGASIMPPADKPPADLSPTELKAVVAYLQSLGGEVTVEITPEDVAAAAARKQKPASATASTHPGAALLTAKGCVACHDVAGTARLVGPPLSNVGERLSAAEIRQSIVDPDAVIAPGFPAGVMLRNFADQLAPEELDQLVAYLSGEVSVRERLSHPGVQLAALILLFNGGVLVALQWASSRAKATAPGEAVPAVPGAKPSRRPVGAALVAVALVAGLYATLRERGPAPPVAPPGAAEPPAPPTQPPAPPAAPPAAAPAATPPATLTAEDGKALYMRTCPACHGPNAKGMPGLGKDMTTSEFVRSKSDAELVEFIKRGRPIDDPLNTTGVPMPPMGANPTLTDAEILAIVRFIRSQSG